jgi:hypothetical protein
LEARVRYAQVVGADGNVREAVQTAAVTLRGARDLGAGVDESDFRVWNDCAGGVSDGALQACCAAIWAKLAPVRSNAKIPQKRKMAICWYDSDFLWSDFLCVME